MGYNTFVSLLEQQALSDRSEAEMLETEMIALRTRLDLLEEQVALLLTIHAEREQREHEAAQCFADQAAHAA